MMGRFAAIFLTALCVGHITAQQCSRYRGKVWFLLDVSENAKADSTSNQGLPNLQKYDILRDQIRRFAEDLNSGPTPQDVEIGIVSYTGNLQSNRATVRLTTPLTPVGTLASRLSNQQSYRLIPDGVLTNNGQSTGGSITANGLQYFIDNNVSPTPGYRNYLVVISAQGSYNTNDRNRASNLARQLRDQKGFRFYVIAVKQRPAAGGLDFLDAAELQKVAGGSDSSVYTRIDRYDQLRLPLFNQVRNRLLCTIDPTTTTTTTTTTTMPPLDNPCSSCTHQSGTYQVEHPGGCTKFYTCTADPLKGYTYIEFDCGPGTLYNDTDHNCGYPKDFSCSAWGRCKAGRSARFPDLCCGKYWQCDDGAVSWVDCPSNQVFNNVTKTCQTVADNSCLQLSPCPVGKYTSCQWRPAPGKPCHFDQYDSVRGISHIMQCPGGRGWNQTDCACTVMGANCASVPGVDVINGARGSNDCKSYLHLSFDGSQPFRAIDETAGGAFAKPWIDRQSVKVDPNGFAIFSGKEAENPLATNPGPANDVIFIPYFANRQFPKKFAMALQFKFNDNAPNTEYVLLSNDRCLRCDATLRLTATRTSTSSNRWTFTFWVSDVNNQEASISKEINVNQQGWSEVKVIVDGLKIRGTVSTSGNNNANTQQELTGTKDTITGIVRTNTCGLSIGQGRTRNVGSKTLVALDGSIDDFKFYECDKLDTLL